MVSMPLYLKELPGAGPRAQLVDPLPEPSTGVTPTATRCAARSSKRRRGQEEGALRGDLPAELLPQAIVGTLRIALRFASSLGTDPDLIGPRVAELLLHGFGPR